MNSTNNRIFPAQLAVEFPHGFEVVPTLVNGRPARFASIDCDGVLVIWSDDTPPEFDNGAWCRDTDGLFCVGMVFDADDGREYPAAGDSLRCLITEQQPPQQS